MSPACLRQVLLAMAAARGAVKVLRLPVRASFASQGLRLLHPAIDSSATEAARDHGTGIQAPAAAEIGIGIVDGRFAAMGRALQALV